MTPTNRDERRINRKRKAFCCTFIAPASEQLTCHFTSVTRQHHSTKGISWSISWSGGLGFGRRTAAIFLKFCSEQILMWVTLRKRTFSARYGRMLARCEASGPVTSLESSNSVEKYQGTLTHISFQKMTFKLCQ